MAVQGERAPIVVPDTVKRNLLAGFSALPIYQWPVLAPPLNGPAIRLVTQPP